MHYSHDLKSWATMRWRIVEVGTLRLVGDFASQKEALIFAVEHNILQQDTDFSFSLRAAGKCTPPVFSLKEVEVPTAYRIADIGTSI